MKHPQAWCLGLLLLVQSPLWAAPIIDYDAPARAPAPPQIPRTRPPGPLPGTDRPPVWPLRQPLTLDEAVRLAVARDEQLKAAVAEVEARVAQVYEVASGAKPQVRFEYEATRFQQPLGAPFSASLFGHNVTIQSAPFTLTQFEDRLGLTQLLSDGGHTRLLVRQSVDAARASWFDMMWQAHQLVYNVRVAFIALLEARASVGVQQQSVQATGEHLALTEESYRAGNAAHADVVYARTPVTRATVELEESRTQVTLANARLNRLIGIDPARSVELSADLGMACDLDLSRARQVALQARSDLASRHHDVVASYEGLDAAKRSRSINVQARAYYEELGYGNQQTVPPNPGWSLGLLFSYPVLDGGLIAAQVKEARARWEAARHIEQDALRRIDEEVVEAFTQLQEAREQTASHEAEVRDAEQSLEVARGQYEAGVGTVLNVLDAQVSLQRARTADVAARYRVERALARLLLVTGF